MVANSVCVRREGARLDRTPGGNPMPDMSENPTGAGAMSSRQRSRHEPSPRAGEAPASSERGGLFRLLLSAGCDTSAAFTAIEEIRSMAGDNVVAQMGVQFSRLERLVTVRLAEHGAKLDVLAVRMDGLKRAMRLMRGALGALVTILGLVFTLLFSR